MEQVYPANTTPADPEAPRWKCVLAAAPQLVLALQYILALWGATPFGLSAANLASVMWVETLMVSFVIYFGALWLWRPVQPTYRKIRIYLFALVTAFLIAFAIGKSPADTLLFVAMAPVTFFGLLMSWRHRTALQQFIARWVVAYAAMLVLIEGLFGGPGAVWHDQQQVLGVGALYFSVLAAVEISGFYLQYIPRHSANLTGTLKQKGKELLSRLQ